MREPVVLTGLGAVTALGPGARRLAERWSAGETAIRDGAARCASFDPTDFLDRKERSRSDRFSQLALVAAIEACSQCCGMDRLPYEPARVGVVVGTCFGGHEAICRFFADLEKFGSVSPFALPMIMPNAAAALIAMRIGATGPSYAVGTACAASSDAIGIGMKLISDGVVDAVVAGGAEACVSPLLLNASKTMGAMSKSGICRPFDRRRDGFVIGEGAALVVMERAEAVERRGSEALAEVAGYGCTTDAHHLTNPEPTAAQAALAMRRALEDAGVAPDQVDYVNAHGTATPLNDRIETRAIELALDGARPPVSSTKSAIGHLVGAAGAAELVATVGALRTRTLGPTIGYEQPEEGLDLDYVPQARAVGGDGDRQLVALSNSFGFGGHNSVLCLRVNPVREPVDSPSEQAWPAELSEADA